MQRKVGIVAQRRSRAGLGGKQANAHEKETMKLKRRKKCRSEMKYHVVIAGWIERDGEENRRERL